VTASPAGKKQTIVEVESLAWRYDDLFSRSRIGTQRGTVWEVLADVFRPGDAILELNCRTREDEIFLAMLDVSPLLRMMPQKSESALSFAPAERSTEHWQIFRECIVLLTFGRLLAIWHAWLPWVLPSSFAFLPGSAFQKRSGFSSMANIVTLSADPPGSLP
jgi:hypothetical protein